MGLYHQRILMAGRIIHWVVEAPRHIMPVCAFPLYLLDLSKSQLAELRVEV